MKATFVETKEFSTVREDYLPDAAYADLQYLLMTQPAKGSVMPGCGGLRKLRIADPSRGKGKRGGARVIYLHVPEANRFYMLDIYGKNEQEDLRPAEKHVLKQLAAFLKKEAIEQYRKWREQNADETETT